MTTETDILYHQDFYAWIYHNIDLIRQGRVDKINLEILIEELEGMAKRDRRELISHLIILVAHLLKWQFQSDPRSGSWRGSIREQRYQIARQLKDSPSLKPYVFEALMEAYPEAVEIAVEETSLPKSIFPQQCPYSVEELLKEDFYPCVH
jgi:hypothetical protein